MSGRRSDEFKLVSAHIEELALGTIRHRNRGVDDSKAWYAVRRVYHYMWDLPGPVGDGLVDLMQGVAWQYHAELQNALANISYGGAHDAGYRSDTGDEDEVEPIANDADAARWLWEPAPRIEVLMDLCRQLDIVPPDVVYHAALDGKPTVDTEDNRCN
jgi:hypothetical protein